MLLLAARNVCVLLISLWMGECMASLLFHSEAHHELYERRMSVKDDLQANSRTCYGDVMGLNPTGKSTTGVPGSQEDVALDYKELMKRWDIYQQVADKNCIQASVIAAIASRESNAGLDLYKTHGWGDHHRAWGIMQCDIKHSGIPCLDCPWDSLCHIEMEVSQELVPYIEQVKAKLPFWTQNQSLQGGVAAYNTGVSRVNSWPDVDKHTTGHDYSNDVIARAQYLYKKGWN